MLGYVVATLLVIYIFILWPHFEGLPPRNARIRRHRLAGDFGLHNTPSVGELYLSNDKRQELLNDVTFIDSKTYSLISKSEHFYLVESRKSMLSLYCNINEYIGTVDFKALQSENFIKVPIEDHILIRFLRELKEKG